MRFPGWHRQGCERSAGAITTSFSLARGKSTFCLEKLAPQTTAYPPLSSTTIIFSNLSSKTRGKIQAAISSLEQKSHEIPLFLAVLYLHVLYDSKLLPALFGSWTPQLSTITTAALMTLSPTNEQWVNSRFLEHQKMQQRQLPFHSSGLSCFTFSGWPEDVIFKQFLSNSFIFFFFPRLPLHPLTWRWFGHEVKVEHIGNFQGQELKHHAGQVTPA